MRWTGAVIGAVVGLFLFRGRLAGVLIGGLLGWLVEWGIRSNRAAPPAPPPPATSDDPYAILEIAPTASDTEVESAYRRLIAQYHPDKVAGAAAELRDLAETRARAINTAYDRILRQRGLSR
jgi:DnaJ-domain-containing protein 1